MGTVMVDCLANAQLSTSTGTKFADNGKDESIKEIVACFYRARCADKAAVARLSSLSAAGEDLASGFLMVALHNGFGVAEDVTRAQELAKDVVFWLLSAVDERSRRFSRAALPYAQYLLSLCFFFGLGLN